MCQVEGCWPFPFPQIKFFFKKKDLWNYCFCLIFWFWRKIFILFYSIRWPNYFIVWLPLLREILGNTNFFYKKIFYKKMSLKNPKTLRKCWENLQPQMPKLKILKMLIFPRALQKLQNWVNFSFFSYLKFFCFSIV